MRKSKNNIKNKSNFSDILFSAMLVVVVGIMPLIVRVAIRPIPPEMLLYFPSTADIHPGLPSSTYPDVFSYWKGILVIVPAVIMAFYGISNMLISNKLPNFKQLLKQVPIILSVVYIVFVIISAIASPYSNSAWLGAMERNEGTFMWLAYFTIFFATMFFVKDAKHTKPILFGLAFSSIIMGAIGVGQLIGLNFFDTDFSSTLVTLGMPGISGVSPRFTIAHGTLYNPNTFGKYTAMVAPVLLIYGALYKGKFYKKIMLLLGGALMLVSIFASGSLGGLIGVVTATSVLVVTYLCSLFIQNRKGMLTVGAVFAGVVVATVLAIIIVQPLNYRATTLFARLRDAAAAETTEAERYTFDDNNIMVYTGENRLFTLTVNSLNTRNWMTITDAHQQNVPYTRTPPTADTAAIYTFHVPGARSVTINRYENAFLLTPYGQQPFIFTLEEGQLLGVRQGPVLFDITTPVPTFGFEGRETWGSSRGYIWSRSIPLMPGRTIIGSGSDTFVYIFPHRDIGGLQVAFGNPHQIVDKAHNLFIQTWLTTGGISALALFGLFAHYLITTFWGLVKSKSDNMQMYGLRLGLLAGISGFIMSSNATDSTVGSTAVFFVLLGLGYAVNAAIIRYE